MGRSRLVSWGIMNLDFDYMIPGGRGFRRRTDRCNLDPMHMKHLQETHEEDVLKKDLPSEMGTVFDF